MSEQAYKERYVSPSRPHLITLRAGGSEYGGQTAVGTRVLPSPAQKNDPGLRD